jgi:hypothetical protein
VSMIKSARQFSLPRRVNDDAPDSKWLACQKLPGFEPSLGH